MLPLTWRDTSQTITTLNVLTKLFHRHHHLININSLVNKALPPIFPYSILRLYRHNLPVIRHIPRPRPHRHPVRHLPQVHHPLLPTLPSSELLPSHHLTWLATQTLNLNLLFHKYKNILGNGALSLNLRPYRLHSARAEGLNQIKLFGVQGERVEQILLRRVGLVA